MFCKFVRRWKCRCTREAALPGRPRAPAERAAPGHDRDAAPAHRQRLPLRARRLALRDGRDQRPVALPRAHAVSRARRAIPSSFALNLAIEELGGTLYAETGRDYSLYQIALHPRQVARGLEILGDLFATPAFRDIDLERKIIVEEILEDLDDRGRNVNVDDQSRRLAWDEHPLGFPITGPAAQRAPVLARATCARTSGASTAPPTWCCASPGRWRTREVARGRRARRSRACRAARGAAPLRAAPRRRRARASAPSTTSRRRRRCTCCFTRCPRPIPATGAARAGARARRRHVDAAALPDLRSEGAGLFGRGHRCTRTTTPRCSRSTPPARTRSCRRW